MTLTGRGLGAPRFANGDKNPLVQQYENYTNISVTNATSSSTAVTSMASTQTTNITNAAAQTSTPGFGVEGAFLAIALVTSILAYGHG